jgi:hypothetical protein
LEPLVARSRGGRLRRRILNEPRTPSLVAFFVVDVKHLANGTREVGLASVWRTAAMPGRS